MTRDTAAHVCLVYNDRNMQTFLATLLACIVASIVLWNFGIAAKIWPSHPLLATTLLATATGILVEKILTRDARDQGSAK